MKTSRYSNIIIGQDERSLLGWRLGIYLYIIDGLLIDTGPYSLRQSSSGFFMENHLQQAALTHVHEDHTGMAAWLQKELRVPVYLHEQSIPFAQKSQIRVISSFNMGEKATFLSATDSGHFNH
ncbi:MBL fold metallo-hydrolase [Syntrophomonas palmitatica]|uniref:MBL fold metallo-hydrolase n=1 Tax=Syntrophomonas palmitatica TaxID=402877 RepID=UPI000A998603|nr:MBL fold metallo-hydrolase [Syntrophomonas palmitatica]